METKKMDIFGDKKITSVTAETRKMWNKNADSYSDALFEEAYSMVLKLIELKNGLDELYSTKMSPRDMLFEQVDLFEDFLGAYKIDTMVLSNAELSAAKPEIQRRLKTAIQNMQYVYKFVLDCAEQAIMLTKDESTELYNCLTEAIAHLVCYIYYQFMIDSSYADLFNVEDQDGAPTVAVCESIRAYAQRNNSDPIDIVVELHKLYQENKPQLGILVNEPDLYAAFENEVGPYIGDLLDLKGIISDKIAREIALGSYDVYDLIELIDREMQ